MHRMSHTGPVSMLARMVCRVDVPSVSLMPASASALTPIAQLQRGGGSEPNANESSGIAAVDRILAQLSGAHTVAAPMSHLHLPQRAHLPVPRATAVDLTTTSRSPHTHTSTSMSTRTHEATQATRRKQSRRWLSLREDILSRGDWSECRALFTRLHGDPQARPLDPMPIRAYARIIDVARAAAPLTSHVASESNSAVNDGSDDLTLVESIFLAAMRHAVDVDAEAGSGDAVHLALIRYYVHTHRAPHAVRFLQQMGSRWLHRHSRIDHRPLDDDTVLSHLPCDQLHLVQPPSEACYTHVLTALVRDHRTHLARTVLNLARHLWERSRHSESRTQRPGAAGDRTAASAPPIKPTHAMYAHVIDAWNRVALSKGDLSRGPRFGVGSSSCPVVESALLNVVQLSRQMAASGLQPNRDIFLLQMQTLALVGDHARAKYLLHEMSMREETSPTGEAYAYAYLAARGHEGGADDAGQEEYASMMDCLLENRGPPPHDSRLSVSVFDRVASLHTGLLLPMLAKMGDWSACTALMASIRTLSKQVAGRRDVTFDVAIYEHAMSVIERRGDAEQCAAVFSAMSQEGHRPTPHAYITIMRAMYRARHCDNALASLHHARCDPNITRDQLVTIVAASLDSCRKPTGSGTETTTRATEAMTAEVDRSMRHADDLLESWCAAGAKRDDDGAGSRDTSTGTSHPSHHLLDLLRDHARTLAPATIHSTEFAPLSDPVPVSVRSLNSMIWSLRKSLRHCQPGPVTVPSRFSITFADARASERDDTRRGEEVTRDHDELDAGQDRCKDDRKSECNPDSVDCDSDRESMQMIAGSRSRAHAMKTAMVSA